MQPVTQTLWHASRPGLPWATAVLIKTASGGIELQINFGEAARQCLTFTDSIAALQRAEMLLTKLERMGFERVRRDRRCDRCPSDRQHESAAPPVDHGGLPNG